MGTSTARRGPTGPKWRQAKGAATRYLAAGTEAPVTAREVAARYISALEGEEGEGGFLAQFRVTRKVAQELGAFWEEERTRGWGAALKKRGLEEVIGAPPEVTAQAVTASLGGPADNLEAVAARAALAEVLEEVLSGRADGEAEIESAWAVARFLCRAVSVRLVLDLGESLEAAAGAPRQLREALAELRQTVDLAADPAGGNPADWRGLVGWQWTTRILLDLREALGRQGQLRPLGGTHGGA